MFTVFKWKRPLTEQDVEIGIHFRYHGDILEIEDDICVSELSDQEIVEITQEFDDAFNSSLEFQEAVDAHCYERWRDRD